MKIEYTTIGDYELPNLTMKNSDVELSKYGRMKLRYLKEHEYGLYFKLLTNGELIEYLLDVDKQAYILYDKLLLDFKKQRNITEELKESNQMRWIQEMNNIDACIDEIIRDTFINN